MLKKKIGWVLGTIVVLGAGGYVLARFNTDSMAHVIYQQMTHPSSPSSDSKIEIKSEKDKAKTQNSNLNDIQKILVNKKYDGGYAVAENGNISQVKYLGSHVKQMNGKYFLATDTQNMLTAAAILRLVDQKKLRLTTPVNQYYDSLSLSNRMILCIGINYQKI